VISKRNADKKGGVGGPKPAQVTAILTSTRKEVGKKGRRVIMAKKKKKKTSEGGKNQTDKTIVRLNTKKFEKHGKKVRARKRGQKGEGRSSGGGHQHRSE